MPAAHPEPASRRLLLVALLAGMAGTASCRRPAGPNRRPGGPGPDLRDVFNQPRVSVAPSWHLSIGQTYSVRAWGFPNEYVRFRIFRNGTQVHTRLVAAEGTGRVWPVFRGEDLAGSYSVSAYGTKSRRLASAAYSVS